MKKIYLSIISFLLLSLTAYSQTKIKVKDDQVFVNNEYSFDVIMHGFAQEIIVKSKSGDILLNFLQFKTASGYKSTTGYDSRGNFSSSSGTTYTLYYRVVDLEGHACEVGYYGLQNKRNVAKYLLDNNLVKDGQLDKDSFIRFCQVHGFSFSIGQ
jgi:hypothetical protein